MSDLRTLDAWRTPSGDQLWIDCPFCGFIHLHGPPAGHRVAHCPRERAPEAGYVLREVGTRPPPPSSRRKRF
jgi:hypothetical protein